MTENNEAAAPAAAPVDGGESNMVVHPTNPPTPIDPIPAPKLVAGDGAAADEVSEEEIVDLRESALEDAHAAQAAGDVRVERFITLGEIVYYGDGKGHVWPAIISHVYGAPADNDEDRNDTYVDLHVFKRKVITDVEKVAQHNVEGPLNGWVFKA